jgi:hypothetical protein
MSTFQCQGLLVLFEQHAVDRRGDAHGAGLVAVEPGVEAQVSS